jgi:transposase InsO family protein
LLVDRVVVTDDAVEIRYVFPTQPSSEHVRFCHLRTDYFTYVPMRHGFLYLVAVLDWYSRYVLAWELSNTLDATFCLTALESALCGGSQVSSTAIKVRSSPARRSLRA